MNKIKLFILLLACSLYPATSCANELSLSSWKATGSQVWRTTYPPNGASELFYPQAGTYLIADYKHQIKPDKELLISTGTMNLNNKTGSDSDWQYNVNNQLWYFGEFKTGGSNHFFDIAINNKINAKFDILYGYSYHHSNFKMTDGIYTIENYTSVNHPLELLNSTYDIIYQGPYIGFKTSLPLSSRLRITGSVRYSPLAVVDGKGWWNLRNLKFLHSGRGHMIDNTLGFQYIPRLKSPSSIFVGYRYKLLSLNNGSENTSSEIVWDKALNFQKGLVLTGTLAF